MADDQTPSISYSQDGDGAECPICLEKMPDSWNNKGKAFMACCGNCFCSSCSRDRIQRDCDVNEKIESLLRHNQDSNETELDRLIAERKLLEKCPLCRQKEPTSQEEIFQYDLKRAKMGKKEAQCRVARAYDEGTGTERDGLKSAFWMKSSAEQGFAPAMYYYGLNFEIGKGCQKSQTEAVHWMTKAASAGYPPAQGLLASYYLNGKGVEKDQDKGVHLLKLGAGQGCSSAQELLAKCYMNGIGVSKDVNEAIRFYEMAAEAGHPVAQYKFGMLKMQSGEFTRSFHWLRKSADQDYASARQMLNNLGNYFLETTENSSSNGSIQLTSTPFIQLMRQASADGDEDAMHELKELEEYFSATCANCNKDKPVNGKLLRCSRCKLLRYCSKDCQKKHWKDGHKKLCYVHG